MSLHSYEVRDILKAERIKEIIQSDTNELFQYRLMSSGLGIFKDSRGQGQYQQRKMRY